MMCRLFNRVCFGGALSLALVFSLVQPARAQVNYYVATNGNNANAGTSTNAPLATLSAARDKIRTLTTDLTILDGATELTIAGWVYPNTKGNNIGILTCTGTTYFGMLFSGTGVGNPLEMRANNNSLLAPNNSCPAGQWHHVAGVWKSGAIQKLYINGVEVADDSTPPTGVISADNWYLGSDRLMSGRYLNGNTKEMRVWARALSAAEIAGLTNTPPTVPPTVVLSRTNQESFTGSQAIVLNQQPLASGANIWMRAGRYAATNTLTLAAQDSGKAGAPIVFSSYPGEQVIFDGGVTIDPTAFTLVADAPTLAKLNTAAAGNVYVQTITNASLITLLTNVAAQISMNELMLQISRFPNLGMSKADNINTNTETGVPNGDGTPASPVGATFHIQGNYATNKWVAELGRIQKARMIGYVSADGLKETLRIHSIDAAGNIRLMDATSYGFGGPSNVERPYLDHLLAELDEPGEWYFDNTDNNLYLWPRVPLTAQSALRVWSGVGVFDIAAGCNFIHVKRLNFANLRGTGVDVNGSSNLVAGCTFRNMMATPYNLWNGTGNKVLSCDFVDVEGGGRIYGGSANNAGFTPAGNSVENCHFTQVYSKSFIGKVVALDGVGNSFRHNLVHNQNGFAGTLGGQEHLVELNEVFNNAIEEGDAGSFYSGASASSWDNEFRHNFFHHIISVPGLFTRAAIFSDDGDQGEILTENVFFKAGEGFKINRAAGHRASGNVFISGISSFLILNGDPVGWYGIYMDYMSNNPTSGDKDNLIGRGMSKFGLTGWQTNITATNWITQVSPVWTNRFPYFGEVMNRWFDDKIAYRWNYFADSVYHSNSVNSGTGVNVPAQATVTNGTTLANLSVFVNPAVMNYQYKTPLPAYAKAIPFQDIGLYLDEYRTFMPDKDTYRAIVNEHWKNTAAAPSGSYVPATVNARIYFNTGEILQELSTIPTYPAASLYAFYSFDDSANRFKDDSGNGRHITSSSGTVTWGGTTGFKNSGAYDFGGGRLIAPINVSPTNLSLMTWGAWVRTDVLTGTGRNKILGHDNGPWDRCFGLDPRYYANPAFTNAGTLTTTAAAFRYTTFTGTNEVFQYGGPIPNTPAPTNTSGWSFVAATYDQTNQWITFHVDLDASTTNDALQSFRVRGFFTDGLTTLAIGGLRPDSANEAWDGAIDNVFIYDGVLSEAQLQTIRNQGKSAIVTVPVTAPVISSITRNLDGTILLAWSSDLFPTTYVVLTSTNAALPVAAWTVENATIPSGGVTTIYTTGTVFTNSPTFFRVRRNP